MNDRDVVERVPVAVPRSWRLVLRTMVLRSCRRQREAIYLLDIGLQPVCHRAHGGLAPASW